MEKYVSLKYPGYVDEILNSKLVDDSYEMDVAVVSEEKSTTMERNILRLLDLGMGILYLVY